MQVIKKDGHRLGFVIRHRPALEWVMERLGHGAALSPLLREEKGPFSHLTWPKDKPVWDHQKSGLEEMKEMKYRGATVFLPVGSGKTSLPLASLAESGAQNLIFVVPPSGFLGIIGQMRAFGQPADKIKVLLPIKNVSETVAKTLGDYAWSRLDKRTGELVLPGPLRRALAVLINSLILSCLDGWMFLIGMDHVRKEALAPLNAIASTALVCLDEVHHMLSTGSLRSAHGFALCRQVATA
jgi:hypothetical protein